MKRVVVIFTILLISIVLQQCSKESVEDQSTKMKTGIPVKIMPLSPGTFSEFLKITGTVKARNQIKIVVEEGGILKKVLKDKGHYVRKGDTLAILENRVLEARFKEALAALRQAELDFKSKQVLFGKKAISENEFLASRYALQRAQAAYELIKARYDKLFITAPLSGYINDRYYDIGAYTTPVTPLFDFIDNEVVKISAGVAERFLNDIKVGTPVELTFDAFPDLKIQSRVKFVSRSIDPLSRTFNIEIEIPNPDRKLSPEMVANLKLLRRSYKNRIVLPLDALIESEQGRYVFVEKNGYAKKISVKIDAVYQDSVLVEGLEPHQNLVVVGQHELTDGDLLLIVEE